MGRTGFNILVCFKRNPSNLELKMLKIVADNLHQSRLVLSFPESQVKLEIAVFGGSLLSGGR